MSFRPEYVAYEAEDSADITLLRPPKTGYDLALRVMALEQVKPHEHYHGQRVDELAARLAAEARLINPPVVAQQGEKYVVLDGATRVTALRRLGYAYLIVQVVDLAQQQVQLTRWNHALYGGNGSALLDVLRDVPGLRLSAVAGGARTHVHLPAGVLGCLHRVDGSVFLLEAHSAATEPNAAMNPAMGTEMNTEISTEMSEMWLHLLNAMVDAYGQWGNVERTLSDDVTWLASQFPSFEALVTFPQFALPALLSLAAEGRTVPAGITRFVIPGRILRLNAPLERLAKNEPLAAKQAWLDDLIRNKLRERQVRYYEEPVVLLDE